MKNNTPSLKKNFILSTMYQILLYIIPLITSPYISRVIGTAGVGISSYTRSLQSYFVLFAALGTASYGAREIARNRENKHDYSKLFWEIEILSILSSSICILVWVIMSIFYVEYQKYLFVLTIGIVAVMFDISWFYTGLEQFKYTIFQNLFFKVVSLFLMFAFVKTSSDLYIYLLITNSITLAANLSMWCYLPKFLCKISKERLELKHHFKETMIYFIPTIATSIYTVLDKTLIGLLIKDTYIVEEKQIINGVEETIQVTKKYSELENGYYEQATKIVDMAKAITFTGLNTIMESRISYLFKKNDIQQIKVRIGQSMDYILFMGFGICFGIIGVASKFVPLFFGEGYDKVVPYLMLLSPVVLIIGISNCLGSQYYTPAGFRKKSAMYLIIGSLINLVLNCVLIPFLWGYGAIIATLVAELAIAILYFVNCNDIINLMDLLKQMWKKAISGVVMLLLCLLICHFISNNIFALLVSIPSGLLVYCFLLFILRDSFVCRVYNGIKAKVSNYKFNRKDTE